jgi:hypothetical protein
MKLQIIKFIRFTIVFSRAELLRGLLEPIAKLLFLYSRKELSFFELSVNSLLYCSQMDFVRSIIGVVNPFSVGANCFSVGANCFSVGANCFSVGANCFSVGANCNSPVLRRSALILFVVRPLIASDNRAYCLRWRLKFAYRVIFF